MAAADQAITHGGRKRAKRCYRRRDGQLQAGHTLPADDPSRLLREDCPSGQHGIRLFGGVPVSLASLSNPTVALM